LVVVLLLKSHSCTGDGWLRFNGLNFLRDRTLKPVQLTYRRDHQRQYRNALEILDADRAQLLAAEILKGS
jgi:hypothetical protein